MDKVIYEKLREFADIVEKKGLSQAICYSITKTLTYCLMLLKLHEKYPELYEKWKNICQKLINLYNEFCKEE